jgi:high-affinity iron transporter
MVHRLWAVLLLVLFIVISANLHAQEQAIWQSGETIRTTLFDAQRRLFSAHRADDPTAIYTEAGTLVDQAASFYTAQLQPVTSAAAPAADAVVIAAFADAHTALDAEDPIAFASARGRIWTGLLWASHAVVQAALARQDFDLAQAWLPLREYRQATSVTLVDSPAARALRDGRQGAINAEEAVAIVGNDLRDAYYFRLQDALSELENAASEGYAVRAAEWAGQAGGYFQILRMDFADKQGEATATTTEEIFLQLQVDTAAQDWDAVNEQLVAARALLADYQPVELSSDLIAERGRLLYLFLDLVYIEYRDGVRNGAITIPIEYQEATTFLAQARSLYEELRPAIGAADPAGAERLNGPLVSVRLPNAS